MNQNNNIIASSPIVPGQFKIPINIIVTLILVLIAILYLPVFNNILTNWDDELYVFYNPYLKTLTLENVKNIFSSYYAGNYHPLTLLSMAMDYQLGGEQPWPYQMTNLLLHLINTLLVYFFIKYLLQLQPAKYVKFSVIPLVTAVLFGIHPLQVESVAWVSERKNVLYTLFFLSSLIVYIKYLKNQSFRIYTLSVILFILSLLSKGMAVPLSVCIIAIDWFAGRNLLSRKVLIEKIPFFLLSLIFGIIAIMAQHSGEAIKNDLDLSFLERIAIASYGFTQYLVKLCYPYHLSAYYPYPAKAETLLPAIYYVCIVLSILLIFLIWRYFRKNKLVVFGSLFFLANISIVIQLLPVGDAIMADRYVYIPSIGFFLIAGLICYSLWENYSSLRKVILAILLIYSTVLSIKTFNRVGVWENSLTLWNDALKHYPENNDRGFLNRGFYYLDKGDYSAALKDFNHLIQIDTKNSGAYIGKGRIKQALNDLHGALHEYNTSLTYRKTYEGYVNRSVIKMELKDFEGAMSDLDSAIGINHLRTEAFINKSGLLYSQNKFNHALQGYNLILKLDPRNSKAYIGRSLVKLALKDKEGALNDLNTLLSFEQSYDGLVNRAVLMNESGYVQNAINDLEKAIQLDSSKIEAFSNYGQILNETGDFQKALQIFNIVLKKDKENNKALLGIGLAKQGLNDFQGALNAFNALLAIEKSYDGYINRAVLKKEIKNYKSALADLDTAAHLDPKRPGASINKGRILFEMKDYQGAEQSYNHALLLDSLSSYAYIGKGLISQASKKNHDALNFFNKALTQQQSYEGYLNRAVLKMEIQDLDGALADLEKAAQINPSRSETYINKGIIELNYGRPGNAIIEFNKILEKTDNYQAYLYRGVAKMNLSDFTGALADLNKSLQLHPSGETYYYLGITHFEMGQNILGCSDLKQSLLLGYAIAKDEIKRNCK